MPDVPHTNTNGHIITNGGDTVYGMGVDEAHGESVTVGGNAVGFIHQRNWKTVDYVETFYVKNI